jgi:hypothetical protein
MILSLLTAGFAFAGKDLDAVKKKGFIQAGVNGGVFGFGMPDEKGVWKGLDVDTAKAVAAAIFGDASKVKYTPLTAQQRFTGYVLVVWPFVVGLAIFLLNPSYMRRLFEPGMLWLPIATLFLMFLGFLVIRRIVDIEV